jgi:hypothetical protein
MFAVRKDRECPRMASATAIAADPGAGLAGDVRAIGVWKPFSYRWLPGPPPVFSAGVETGDVEELARRYPDAADMIRAIARSVA